MIEEFTKYCINQPKNFNNDLNLNDEVVGIGNLRIASKNI